MSVSVPESRVPTQQKGMTQNEIERTLQTIADGFRHWQRAPILHRPDEVNLNCRVAAESSTDP